MLTKFNDLIISSAQKFRVDANLIRAIIITESSGEPTARRFEPNWRLYNNPQSWAESLGIDRQTEETEQATSWGLMQVMGAVARDLAYKDRLTGLMRPDLGVYYGVKKLATLFTKYPTEDDVISAYNQGNNRMNNGQYCNYRYVDKVFTVLRSLRDGQRPSGYKQQNT